MVSTKKTRKKVLAILCVIAFMLTACGEKKENCDNSTPVVSQSEKENTENTEQAEDEEKLPKSIHAERVIAVDGMKNVRELGGLVTVDGKTIKKGLIFRASEMSGTHANITDQGKKTMLEVYEIKTELDLRSASEASKESGIPTVGELGTGVKYIHMSAQSYLDFLKGATNEGEILRVFADYNNYPIVFHCVYGADRTGTVAFILEALVGISYDDLVADYELTGWRDREYVPFYYLTVAFGKEPEGEDIPDKAYELELEGDDIQDKAYRLCSNVFGLTEMEISNIKNIFLTDSAVFEADSLTKPYSNSGNSAVFHLNMRSSASVKSVEYNGKAVDFQFSGNTLTLSNVALVSETNGTITFDDGSTLSFEG